MKKMMLLAAMVWVLGANQPVTASQDHGGGHGDSTQKAIGLCHMWLNSADFGELNISSLTIQQHRAIGLRVRQVDSYCYSNDIRRWSSLEETSRDFLQDCEVSSKIVSAASEAPPPPQTAGRTFRAALFPLPHDELNLLRRLEGTRVLSGLNLVQGATKID